MAVSTVFLQTTEDDSNTFADTTFHIDLPMLLPTYKLSIATFMFRPSIILGEDEYIKVRFKLDRDASNALTFPHNLEYKFENGEWGNWKDQIIEASIPIGMLQYNSGFDHETLTEKMNKTIQFEMTQRTVTWVELGENGEVPNDTETSTYKTVTKDDKRWYYDEKAIKTNTHKITMEIVTESSPKNRLVMYVLKPLSYHNKNDKCYWNITSFELIDISKALSHLTGITPGIPFTETNEKVSDKSTQVFKTTMQKPFNPQYWNYITLTCNKVYNTATIVNQTYYNTTPSEATQFYKCQIMGYMVNQSPTQQYITTGVPTSNEYLITPSDFNSIRFNLHFDNGEPVKLYSPMTIVLNITPV